jgi:hypothetical protein
MYVPTSVMKKVPKVNIHKRGENSPSLVTLLASIIHAFLSFLRTPKTSK